jgi:hypothetical protein
MSKSSTAWQSRKTDKQNLLMQQSLDALWLTHPLVESKTFIEARKVE